MIEMVWQYNAQGERDLELWSNGRRLCRLTDVANGRMVEGMVSAWNNGKAGEA